MEDIKENEYIRTYDGDIGILVEINNKNYNYLTIDCKNDVRTDRIGPQNLLYLKNEDIIKHSTNIIDLIEVNDIVKYKLKGMNSVHISEVKGYIDARKNEKTLMVDGYKLEQVKILKILTHEQFEKASYEV